MTYLEALQKRYSVKKFDKEKTVPLEILKNILEAGRLSVSSLGLQPYEIIVVASEEMKQKLIPAFYNPSQICTCSHLLVLISRRIIDHSYIDAYFNHIKNVRAIPIENLDGFRNSIYGYISIRDENAILEWNERQAYILLGNLIFAAALENVDTCPMEGFNLEKINEILEISPETQKVSVTLALGYRAEDDAFQKMKKVRKPDDKLFKFIE
jgi:nitroreductase